MNRIPTSATEAGCRMPDAGLALRSVGWSPAFVNVNLTVNEKPSSGFPLPAPTGSGPASRYPASVHVHLQVHESSPLPPSARPPGTRARASRGRAFTLVELMVATAITSLLLLGMTGIFDQAMKAWRLSSRRGDAEREVRAALSTIQRDLKGLVVTTELPMYLNSLNRNQTGWKVSTGLLPPVTDTIFASSRFFFLSTQSQSAQGPNQLGDLCGIGYYLAWNNTDRAYHLYRYFRPSADQFASLSNFIASSAPLISRTGLFPTNSADEIVAANVVNFRAEVKSVTTAGVGFATNTVLTNRPSYVQLELTAYGSEAVRSFSTSNDWANPTNLLKFGRSHMWRVDL